MPAPVAFFGRFGGMERCGSSRLCYDLLTVGETVESALEVRALDVDKVHCTVENYAALFEV